MPSLFDTIMQAVLLCIAYLYDILPGIFDARSHHIKAKSQSHVKHNNIVRRAICNYRPLNFFNKGDGSCSTIMFKKFVIQDFELDLSPAVLVIR